MRCPHDVYLNLEADVDSLLVSSPMGLGAYSLTAAKAEEASSLLLKLGGRAIADIDEASAAALAA